MAIDNYFSGGILDLDFRDIMSRLVDEFGPDLHIISSDDKWINFLVNGMTDDELFNRIDHLTDKIFGGDIERFQVLRPLYDSNVRGVFLHHLATPELREEFRAGVWNY